MPFPSMKPSLTQCTQTLGFPSELPSALRASTTILTETTLQSHIQVLNSPLPQHFHCILCEVSDPQPSPSSHISTYLTTTTTTVPTCQLTEFLSRHDHPVSSSSADSRGQEAVVQPSSLRHSLDCPGPAGQPGTSTHTPNTCLLIHKTGP